jgi:hypothetical protein
MVLGTELIHMHGGLLACIYYAGEFQHLTDKESAPLLGNGSVYLNYSKHLIVRHVDRISFAASPTLFSTFNLQLCIYIYLVVVFLYVFLYV